MGRPFWAAAGLGRRAWLHWAKSGGRCLTILERHGNCEMGKEALH
jgi:hypothetical protein